MGLKNSIDISALVGVVTNKFFSIPLIRYVLCRFA